MKSTGFALALLLVSACGDDGNKTQDGGGSGSDGGGSGDGGMTCDIPALPTCAAPVNGSNITLQQLGNASLFGGDAAILVTAPVGDPRLFVVGRGGQIKIVEADAVLAEPFFDLDEVIPNLAAGGEQGLLGLAFHPEYKCNGQFFIFYTTANTDVLSRCSVSATDPNKAATSCTTVLSIPDFASNHNGGMIEFGDDGFLYIGTGDGGNGGDPRRNGQALETSANGNTQALLGKMLRIDVDRKDAGKEYAIPASNPFAAGGGAPEIWMYGLRNPWRWSFDRANGDIWIGDVGQVKTEELTAIKANEQSGKNLGWSIWEGDRCCATLGIADGQPDPDSSQNGCDQNGTQQMCDANAPGLVFPQKIYRHPATANAAWISIIAGQTYRGSCYPDIVGWHYFTDHRSTSAGLKRAQFAAGNTLTVEDVGGITLPDNITSIHADARGELWVTRLNGTIYHLTAGP